MSRTIRGAMPAALAMTLFVVAPVSAQSGFGLKGHVVYNASTAQTFQDDRDRSAAGDFVGFNVGAEYVLPFGVGIGATGYASGDPRDTDRATVFMVLAEANYVLDLPGVPVSPFAGAHVGVGSWSWSVRDEVMGEGIGDLDRARFGWQLGLRVRLLPGLSLEGLYRRMSAEAEDAQQPGFESDQVLLGIRIP
jgi:hypothetical protein